jgi:beta-lactamase class A
MSGQTANKTVSFMIAALLLVGAGWYAHGWFHRCFNTANDRRIKLKGFQFVSPLLDVELPEGYGVGREPIPFKYKVKGFVEQQIKSGTVKEMSVYYRDLSDGPWFGINEKVHYNPASMMKVPIMIGWLKRAEKDPSVLQRKFVFEDKGYPGPQQGIKPAKSLTAGAGYTVDELLSYMMNYSDNKAMWLLYNGLTDEEYAYIFDSMDVANDPSDGNNSITVHGYSGFLRILYNASFLNREMSEKALKLMSYQDFPYGMAAGVPKGVIVASKFGEYGESSAGHNPALVQLHEFGIVYHPKGPYILGILTMGNDLAKQTDIIRAVSAMVYKEVDASVH